jgi:hypothetical protein
MSLRTGQVSIGKRSLRRCVSVIDVLSRTSPISARFTPSRDQIEQALSRRFELALSRR